MEKLKLEDFLVVKKKSRLEVDAMRLGLDWKKVRKEDEKTVAIISKKYVYNEKFIKRNIDSLRELYLFVDLLLDIGFKRDNIIEREELCADVVENKKAIIVLGGDNHLMWVLDQLEYLGFRLGVIGCNSDIIRSAGSTLYDNKNTIDKTLKNCEKGKYIIEKWPKIEGEILYDNKKIKLFPAAQEYIFGEYAGSQMTRVFLINHKEEELRGNCLIVTNGVGSSGRYSTVHQILFGTKDIFSRESRELRHILDGPFGGKERYKYIKGKITDNQILELISYNDNRGVATADSIDEKRYVHEFPMGAIARVWVSDKVSRIIRDKNI